MKKIMLALVAVVVLMGCEKEEKASIETMTFTVVPDDWNVNNDKNRLEARTYLGDDLENLVNCYLVINGSKYPMPMEGPNSANTSTIYRYVINSGYVYVFFEGATNTPFRPAANTQFSISYLK